MKKAVFVLLFVMTYVFSAMACEIEFEVQGTQKSKYNAGEEVIVKVKVTLTHRVCNVAMANTKFDTKGFEMLGGTDWKEVSPGVWERKLKMKAQKTKSGKMILTVTRTCDKEGGSGTLTLDGEKA